MKELFSFIFYREPVLTAASQLTAEETTKSRRLPPQALCPAEMIHRKTSEQHRRYNLNNLLMRDTTPAQRETQHAIGADLIIICDSSKRTMVFRVLNNVRV